MKSVYKRKLSPYERFFLAKIDDKQFFSNQGIIEGEGVLDKKLWEKAVEKASAANPGSRVTLRGKLMTSQWVDTKKTPRIREIEDTKWDGLNSNNIPYLPDKLCPLNGPVCEVILIYGKQKRVIINSLHSVMDGKATIAWALDIFRALRGEQPIGSNSKLTDIELSKTFTNKSLSAISNKYIAPTGKPDTYEKGAIWIRKTVKGFINKAIPRISIILTKEASKLSNGKFCIMIPVDLRRRNKKITSVGNLTGNLFIEIDKNSTVNDIQKKIIYQLKNYYECMLPKHINIVKYIPIKLLHSSLKKVAKQKNKTGLFTYSGIITHLGRLHVNAFSGGGFIGKTWYSCNSMSGDDLPPLFISISETESFNNHTNILIGISKPLASKGRLEKIVNSIINEIDVFP
ncbi:MAG: hypothetical protein JRJ44_04125 [Deltaproteobacteria bacterium]|nr:hypothetical protein [Deltaproteobacteria bacterium]